jgi:hypothetical protein
MNDNGGAIHSLERLLDILSHRLVYPHLSHENSAKDDPDFPMSEGAALALKGGRRDRLRREHVQPRRAYTVAFCNLVDQGAGDVELMDYIKRNFRIVLLDVEETRRLNLINRSRIVENRLDVAGIKLAASRMG